MLRPLMTICQVLGIAFIFGGIVGLVARRGNSGMDVVLIATGALLLFAYSRLELASKRVAERSQKTQEKRLERGE